MSTQPASKPAPAPSPEEERVKAEKRRIEEEFVEAKLAFQNPNTDGRKRAHWN